MNNEFCCFDCAMNAMSATLPIAKEGACIPAIPQMVSGVCPECGSDETIDLAESGR
jgi:hypothetical protein